MTSQPSRSYTRLSIAIVVAALVIGAAFFASPYLGSQKTVTETTTSMTTVIRSQTNSTITSCVVAVPPPQGMYLRLVSDSGSPLAGYQVTIQYTPQAYCNPNPGGVHVYTMVAATNSSGWILFQGWLYDFVFIYSGSTYNFTVPGDPMAWTIGTISLPSGTLTTRICGLGGGSLSSTCQNSATTTISPTGKTTTVTPTTALGNASLLAECPQPEGLGPSESIFTLVAGSTTPTILCMQLYYFNPTTSVTLNPLDELSILALQYIPNGSVSYPRSFNGAPNFTVGVSQTQLVLGGPNNLNEGTTIAYSFEASPGASGTYQLGLSYWRLTSNEPVSCGYFGALVAGDGKPNYSDIDHCITTGISGSPPIPGIPYATADNFIYFRLVGITNSTAQS